MMNKNNLNLYCNLVVATEFHCKSSFTKQHEAYMLQFNQQGLLHRHRLL